MQHNPFRKDYSLLRGWQMRCQQAYIEQLRARQPLDLQALAHAEATLAQMQAGMARLTVARAA